MTMSLKQLMFTGLMGCVFGALCVVALSHALDDEPVFQLIDHQDGIEMVLGYDLSASDCESEIGKIAMSGADGILECREQGKDLLVAAAN